MSSLTDRSKKGLSAAWFFAFSSPLLCAALLPFDFDFALLCTPHMQNSVSSFLHERSPIISRFKGLPSADFFSHQQKISSPTSSGRLNARKAEKQENKSRCHVLLDFATIRRGEMYAGLTEKQTPTSNPLQKSEEGQVLPAQLGDKKKHPQNVKHNCTFTRTRFTSHTHKNL